MKVHELGPPTLLALTAFLGCAEPTAEERTDLTESKLTGGTAASVRDFPSTIRFFRGCTGAKIGHRLILTAAHCVVDTRTGDFLPGFAKGVRVTSHPSANTVHEDPRQGFVALDFERWEVHPAWLGRPAGSEALDSYYTALDIAIGFISEETAARFAAVPSTRVDFTHVAVDDPIVIMGHGCENGIGSSSDPSRLKFQETRAISANEAAADGASAGATRLDLIRVGVRYFYTPGRAKLAKEASICPGDSGGPVYRKDRKSIVGVNTYYNFIPGDSLSYTNWHTRTSQDWVEGTLRKSIPISQKSLSSSKWCVDIPAPQAKGGTELIAYPCHGEQNQIFSLSPEGAWTASDGSCIEARGDRVVLATCRGAASQRWRYDGRELAVLDKCLSVHDVRLTLVPCDQGEDQRWATN